MQTEDKIRIILDALHASQEVKDAMQEYITELVDTSYHDGYSYGYSNGYDDART